MRYFKKDEIINAWQMPLPFIALQILKANTNTKLLFRPNDFDDKTNNVLKITIITHKEILKTNNNDWIIQKSNGDIFACTNKEFTQEYCKINGGI